ncbi:MAG: hypothetical protein P4M15_13155, partial [Alphaproteobacteria bacterium]|nr:hypothetical protein [Alphaproteobacteria bacterium]
LKPVSRPEAPIRRTLRHLLNWSPPYAGMTTALLVLLLAGDVYAANAPATPVESPQLQKCLKRADDLPDMAAAEAQMWIKKNGGNDAHLCFAFAQANRGMHSDAAREFWYVAAYYDKNDTKRAVLMHAMSGHEFMRAKEYRAAEFQYGNALKIAPGDVSSLIGRAESRTEQQKYWDALDDLNKAVAANPRDAYALRQRARVWLKLDNTKNAEEDFSNADALDGTPPAK